MMRVLIAPLVLLLAQCTSTPATSGEVAFEVAQAQRVLEDGQSVLTVLRTTVQASDADGDGWIRGLEWLTFVSMSGAGLLPLFAPPAPPVEQ